MAPFFGRVMPEVAVTTPDGRIRTLRLESSRISLGRARDNVWSYPEDEGLSRHHMALERRGEEWWVADLNSKNGTYLNGERLVGARALRPGDRVAAGRVLLEFEPGWRVQAQTVVFERTGPSSVTASTDLASLLERRQPGEPGGPQAVWTAPATALLRAGRELGHRRPLPELFQVILDLALEAVGAGRGLLLTRDAGGLTVRASRGEGFRISTTVRDRVLEGRTSLLIRDTCEEESLREQASILAQGVRAFMAVPLQTDDRVTGLLYVDTPRPRLEFAPEDLDLLTVMANVAAIRIERDRLAEIEQAERLLEAELEQAAEIQQRVLPASPPVVEGLELAGYNAACRMVGGDCYDFLLYPDGKVVVVIADAAGKGLPAALLMMNLQARVQAMGEAGCHPAALLTRLNASLAATCPQNRFVTLFLGLLDPRSGELAYANAGHNPPLWLRRDGQVVRLTDGGPVLGILPLSFQQYGCRMEPGEVLLLYSDGVTEALNPEGEEFGEERLTELLTRHRHACADVILAAVCEAVGQWAAGRPAADDVTVVVVRRTG